MGGGRLSGGEHSTDLPGTAAWFFVVAPPLLALLFDPSCAKTVDNMARATLALTLYTLATGAAVHFSFNAAARSLAKRASSLSLGPRLHMLTCWSVHAGIVAVIVLISTLAQHWYLRAIYPNIEEPVGVIWRGVLVAFAYVAIASVIGRLQRSVTTERLRAETDRTAALEARLALLQAQLQPHFLFNSLNLCAGLIRGEPDLAEATLDKLSGFLRYALESTSRKVVPLREELAAMVQYLDVQKERFGGRLKYRVSVPEDDDLPWVPPMLLQPLVENAIVHGLNNEQGGVVGILVQRHAKQWTIDVEDSGGHTGERKHQGTSTGQPNVAERLRLVFGEEASLQLGRASHGGYLARVQLPLQTNAELCNVGASHPSAVPDNVGASHPSAVPHNVGASHPSAVPHTSRGR